MKLLFKGTSPNIKSVGETNFKEHYPSVDGTAGWKEMQAYIKQATSLYIVDYVGENIRINCSK